MLAFVGEPLSKKHIVNHLNSIRHDNRLVNLEYCTKSENTLHSYKHGRSRNKLRPVSMTKNSETTSFDSASEASRHTGICRCRIRRRCLSGKPLDGYTWKYENRD